MYCTDYSGFDEYAREMAERCCCGRKKEAPNTVSFKPTSPAVEMRIEEVDGIKCARIVPVYN